MLYSMQHVQGAFIGGVFVKLSWLRQY